MALFVLRSYTDQEVEQYTPVIPISRDVLVLRNVLLKRALDQFALLRLTLL